MVDLFKYLPVLTMASGAVASKDKIHLQFDKIMNITKIAATQQETNDLAKMVYLDTLDDTQPKADEFTAYVARNMKMRNGNTRDVTKDLWGSPYRLEYRNTLIVVSSAGPDAQFASADDVIASYHRNY